MLGFDGIEYVAITNKQHHILHFLLKRRPLTDLDCRTGEYKENGQCKYRLNDERCTTCGNGHDVKDKLDDFIISYYQPPSFIGDLKSLRILLDHQVRFEALMNEPIVEAGVMNQFDTDFLNMLD